MSEKYGTNINACFISNQKLLILSTYSVIATILLINSALYIIPVILIIMGNCFWFYFVLLGLVSGEGFSIINTSPPPSSHAPRWLSFWAAGRSRPKAATGRARAGSYIRLFVVLGYGILIVLTSPARATPLARPVIGGKSQQTMNYAVGLIPDKRSNYPWSAWAQNWCQKFLNNRGALLNITRQECVIVRLDTLS